MNNIEAKYHDLLEKLFSRHQAFHKVGEKAYKPGLDTALTLAAQFGNPHKKFKTIHVAGTNGKGSTASLIAAVLTAAGYKTGLYTSPHLVDFSERIRINGVSIDHGEVISFIERFDKTEKLCEPSFFELTTIMAFDYFARNNVDVAVIETGLGGRLDTTNIIAPELSIITNISFDHTSLLGNTLEAIAAEKAGIIKNQTPVVIGETNPATKNVFIDVAKRMDADIYFADNPFAFDINKWEAEYSGRYDYNTVVYKDTYWGDVSCELTGDCQHFNANTALVSLKLLSNKFVNINRDAVNHGFSNVCKLTGLTGRWSTLTANPTVIFDTGHNVGAWEYTSRRLKAISQDRKITAILGFVNDKDYKGILELLPVNCRVFIVEPQIERAAPSDIVTEYAKKLGLHTVDCKHVSDAYKKALADIGEGDMIFVGGSNYVVAELLALQHRRLLK